MKLVVDASVALKWYLRDRGDEDYIAEAVAVGGAIERPGCELFAPAHWLIEVLSVLARSEPKLVDTALVQLTNMQPTIVASAHVLKRATEIAISLKAHLFDTLYHAVALECDAMLVTADARYLGKAAALGNIIGLADFTT